jgi:hypothetical protein
MRDPPAADRSARWYQDGRILRSFLDVLDGIHVVQIREAGRVRDRAKFRNVGWSA